jgi:hypothetical protein
MASDIEWNFKKTCLDTGQMLIIISMIFKHPLTLKKGDRTNAGL